MGQAINEQAPEILIFDQQLLEQRRYWADRLSDLAPAARLKPIAPGSLAETVNRDAITFNLPQELCSRLETLTGGSPFLLYTALLAALKVCLYKYTHDSTVVVGSPGRKRGDATQLENALVIVDEVADHLSFRQLLLNVRQTLLDAYQRQRYPYDRLRQDLFVEASAGETRLFEVALLFDELHGPWPEVGEGLRLTVRREGPQLCVLVEYDRRVYEVEWVERFWRHYEQALQSGVEEPEQAISELEMLSQTERRQLLEEWNETSSEYPRERRIHELFEEQVERTPEAVAVVYREEQLTYRELNRRANQLAHYLRERGVGPEVMVGVCVERSVEMVVGLLGILKAGGAYVPLDPEYPRERLAFMLEDAQVSVLLTQERFVTSLPKHEARVCRLDSDWGEISQGGADNLSSGTTSDNLAYVIYTSGSTGQPKGVSVVHQAISRLTINTNYVALSAADVIAQASNEVFDAATFEIWGALLHGARLVIFSKDITISPRELALNLRQHQVSVLFITTALFNQVVSQVPDCFYYLRYLLFGGEAVDPKWVRAALLNGSPQRLLHVYGPTESTTFTTWHHVQQVDEGARTIPIGRPLSNTTTYILDPSLNPAAIDTIGELYIGGAGLARGYLNRPDLTADRFVPHPFSTEPGARLYRTGDLAKYLPDGNIEFLGRVDQQIKLRGYRIELGEIETVLSQHPEIEQAVVLLRGEGSEQRLVAYLVAEQDLRHSELRTYLKERLPEYMIPSAFVQLEELPLTPNGKIDRRALPAPEQGRLEAGQEYVAAQTPVEELLVGIWEEVLGVNRVGIHDNFFELGGHSLLATQLISRVRTAFGIEMPLRQLFESPTVQELAAAVESALRQESAVSAPAIERAPREQGLPLSYAQQRLWFIDQLEPNSALYNIPAAVRLKGELNLTALGQTFSEVVRRHEVLRTTFVNVDGEPLQHISPAQPLSLPIVDLSHLTADERETEAQRLATAEAQRPFDLSRGPLFRVQVLRLSVTEHILLCTMHHIVSDGWSIWMLVREVAALYEAFSQDQPSPLPELPIQYADYAVWQRQWLEGAVLEAQLAYWREQLSGAPSVLELPTDYPRPAVQSFRGAAQSIRLSAELTEKLRQLSRAEGVTLFMTLLSAFSVLLSRLSGQADIVVGTPIANRTRVETEGLIGFFVNTLVLRTKVEAEESFRALLARVREVTLGAYSHQEVPFEKLVEELQPDRDLSHSPLFQVMFVLQNAPRETLRLGEVELRSAGATNETAKFDLTLVLTESGDGLTGVWQYSTELFAAETIERWGGHFQTLLEAIASEPEQAVAELPLLTEGEREQLLIEWNQTAREYPDQRCIHELFEEQVERTPEAVAVVYDEQQVTYAELNSRANQLAHYLRGMGVGPEVLVGICVERSVEMVIGLLGILKAGGAYVPLDPEYPQERLSFMLEDARVSVLLTEQKLEDKLPEQPAQIVRLDADWESIAQYSDENSPTLTGANNLAYINYTSGSTGKPKAVEVCHRGIARLLFGVSYVSLGDTNIILQASPIFFDASTFEVWGALLHGGRCVLLPQRTPTVSELGQAIEKHRIDTLWLTSSLFNVVIDESPEILSNIQQLLIGGEALSVAHVDLAIKALPATQIINGYGPTESTTFTCCYSIPKDADLSKSAIAIGTPISNTEVYLLDAHLQPVPVGIAGELYIGGAGLARGYLNRPDLTADRFIPHPFSTEPGARLYRTGDLAKYLPDGNIEFLGRIDQQIKLRGYRIELGEIETVLSQHSAIEQAVVLLRGEGAEQRLAAYLVAARELQHGELRTYLKERLPDYMIPSTFVQLEELPLTPNGKIDRRALPTPGQGWLETGQEYVAPQTPVEELLADIWEEVLGVEMVGIHDNFFELGGHSLLATQLISRVRTAFGIEMPLRQLFESPTVQELAIAVESALRQESAVSAPAIERAPRDCELPLSYAQQRLWFIDQLEPNSALYNIPAAVRLKGELNLIALEQTFNEIVRRHEVLRTSFTTTEGSPVQLISTASDVELPLVNLSHLATDERETEAQRLAAAEAQRPFDLSLGPLFRVQVLRLSQTEHILLCTMHHIVSDGWSMGVLIREVAALYEAYSQHQPSPLPELSIQYADYALWQRQWLTGEVLASQLSYWREQLSGAPSVLELPTDYPRPAVQSFRGAVHRIELSAELTESLRKISRAEGVTLFMTLLSAFSVLLSRLSGQSDIVVATPIANRTRVETESLIGFFVNTLVLRTKVEPTESFSALLARVREVTLGAYSHQEVPFEKLVEELQPERDLSHSPLFQVMFVLQNAPRETLRLGEVELRSVGATNETAKFDLTLELMESAQGLAGTIEYSTELFAAETIERWSKHFQTLLEAVASEPEQAVAELEILSDAEREQLLIGWNQTAREYPRERCIHELFEEQVERTPEAVAIVYENQQITYGELNSRANQLAHYLRGMGVGPEALVGLCVERSIEMVVGLLGILKAGGAYVPLDPEYPRERLGFMLEDGAISVLLTVQRLVKRLPEHRSHIVYLDAEDGCLASQSELNPINLAAVESLAYIIYTSGSTGTPKGVAVSHSALVNHSTALGGVYDLRSSDLVLQFASLNFDVAAEELYPSWLSGAAVVLLPSSAPMSAAEFFDFITRQRLTVVNVPALYWHELVAELGRARIQFPATLRLVVAGSEVISSERLAAWHQFVPDGIRWINAYGPTEATITSTLYESFEQEEPGAGGTVPIGRPISNTESYLLDTRLEPVPVGVAGELYIGGVGLARGYLNRPDLTAERFLPHPFTTEPGARLYRTGDLAKYLPDGNIEFLGRVDQQIKLRGYRIELGEIEAALAAHTSVREAVVTLSRKEGAEQRLIAYLVISPQGELPSVSELRGYLKERLPDYMIPSAFVQLEELPLTPNGKIDRRALPTPEEGRLEAGQQYVAPQTQVEELLVGIWEEVLGVERVGIHDNFFELGGHSLLATQLISRVRTAFGIEMPLRQLFESPTVDTLAEAVEAMLRQESAVSVPAIKKASREQGLMLSYAQQRLWFIDQLEPNSALYNIPLALRLTGDLNLRALTQTFSEIVRRHEVLRTSFVNIDGEPLQHISAAVDVTLPLVDLSHLSADERETEARRLANQEAQRPFDLSRGPLFRVQVLRLSVTEHILLCTMHHIVSDGWSIWMLVREVAALYEAFSQGQPSPLPELPIQYADYAVWQRQWLTGEVLETQLSYWREQLSGAPSVLELPTDYPRPAVQSFRGAAHRIELSAELTEVLRKISRAEGVTLFMTLLSAFSVLLSRLSGQDDIVVGTPIANRTRVETEGLIGFFVNTLVLRTKVEAEENFRELLRRMREVTLGAYSHQEVPFEKLVEELQPDRDLSHSPLFQVLFTLQNTPGEALELAGVQLSAVTGESEIAKLDLALELMESGDGLTGVWQYSTDLFDAATIERMSGHFQTLLEAITSEPEQAVAELEILSDAEREQLLIEWNQTAKEYPEQRCIHELFEEQVERTPEAVAVVYEDERVTYGELNSRANQLAHYLRGRGVGPEVLVGICVERSVEMVIGLLGILKAGGAYVPLDPEYPRERLGFMLEDARVSVLLTERGLKEALPQGKDYVICLDEDWPGIAKESGQNIHGQAIPDNPAYVIYTSGSTGVPKGVVTSHKALVNSIFAMLGSFDIDSRHRLLQFVSLSFDASVEEIFLALTSGASLVLHENPGGLSISELLQVCEQQGVTTLHLPPAHWHQVVEQLSVSQNPVPHWLKLFITGSESILIQRLVTWSQLTRSPTRFINAYGPTEAAITAAFYEAPLEATAVSKLARLPIGKPIANIQLYILDEEQEPAPVGVAGELYIGGTGLARGYLNRPDLTAERFLPHPFSTEPGARLYRTGDLAKYLPDGNIEFLGRIDQQIKLRGYRIELGEIEAVLGQHPAVREAVVTLFAQDSEQRLVAYLVAEGELQHGELRSHLKERLPEYMIPSAFVQLAELPLTPNGKIDRRALPTPEEGRLEAGQQYVAPQTQVEEMLVGIWEEVLGVERVGVHDNFFELGGHSLLATQLISRVRAAFEIEMPLRQLFESPTVHSLAVAIGRAEKTQSPSDEVEIRSTSRGGKSIDQLLTELENLSQDEALNQLGLKDQ